jgi:hypothetical protein
MPEADLESAMPETLAVVSKAGGDRLIERGAEVVGGNPFSGAQPKNSPGLRVSHAVAWTDYDVAPEVTKRVGLNLRGQHLAYGASERARLPGYVFDHDGRLRGVYVQARVDELGVVSGVSAFIPPGQLADSAERVAAEWRFSPATWKGSAVAVWVTFPISGE